METVCSTCDCGQFSLINTELQCFNSQSIVKCNSCSSLVHVSKMNQNPIFLVLGLDSYKSPVCSFSHNIWNHSKSFVANSHSSTIVINLLEGNPLVSVSSSCSQELFVRNLICLLLKRLNDCIASRNKEAV